MAKDLLKTEINVINNKIGIMRIGDVDYISLTDLVKYQNPEDPSGVIRNWMSNRNSFDYYDLWKQINNENFNSVEFHVIKTEEVPYNRFTMTPKRWKDKFNAIGIVPSAGKYSLGTFAHPDIAFEFASWLSPEFKFYLIKKFERLKKNEAHNFGYIKIILEERKSVDYVGVNTVYPYLFKFVANNKKAVVNYLNSRVESL